MHAPVARCEHADALAALAASRAVSHSSDVRVREATCLGLKLSPWDTGSSEIICGHEAWKTS